MNKAFFKIIVVGLTFLSVGCAQLGSSKADGFDSPTRTVAVDLVSVLGQLPGLDPFSTTTQVTPAGTEFGVSVVQALQDLGYGVQRVASDQGETYVSYRTTQTVESTGTVAEFEVGLRGIRVARQYADSAKGWIPTSALRVYGAEPTRVLVNDDLYSRRADSKRLASGVVFYDAQGQVLESRDFTVPVAARVNDGSGTNQANSVQRSLSFGQASVFGRQRALAREDQRDFETIAEVVLRFPTADPSTLGVRNKRAIAALLKRHDIATDRFIIQGCSQGASLIWDGTESVSLERQQRVNKELLVSGVLPQAIVEEGCLSRSTDTQLSQQSVRLQLARVKQPQSN